MSAADYIELLQARRRIIAAVDAATSGFDALLMPTVPFVAPKIADLAEEPKFVPLNLTILRNPSVVNFLDRCAITLPVQRPGDLPVGLSLVGEHGADKRLLAMALAAEEVLAPR
jgi:aspartyl-tRNA(Asn)/glutamyl-tRNA(Gln) amidotransferase subunit A